MHVVSARDYVSCYLSQHYQDRKLLPEDLVLKLSKSIGFQVTTNKQNHNYIPQLKYLRSNIKGYYYKFICDSCSGGCTKGYIHVFNGVNSTTISLLCGKCSHVKYKRKTSHEKNIMKLFRHPEVVTKFNPDSATDKELIMYLDYTFLLQEIESTFCGRTGNIHNIVNKK